MFDTSWQTLLEIAIRTIAVYLALLLGIRAAGKREIGQLTPFDLVVLLLIANAAQNAMTGSDVSLAGGLLAAATLLVVNAIVAFVRMRSRRVRRFIEGVPTVLVAHGAIQHGNLAKEGFTSDDLLEALREHEVRAVDEVELAVLEIDGSVSVIRKDATEPEKFHHSRHRQKRALG